jgi:hypothetical protein
VGVADERRVVAPDERAVERRADARIGLRADDDESPDPEARQHGLEGRFLEVAVGLLDERLGVSGLDSGTSSQASLPLGSCSSWCWTQTTGTPSPRAFSTRPPTFATTASRS